MTTADVNNPSLTDIPGEVYPDGELPSQGGGMFATLMPGSSTFVLPSAIDALFEVKAMRDGRKTLPNGQPNPTFGQDVARLVLKFDKNAPLVVADGKFKGQPFTATFNSNPRPRGKVDDPTTQWISDMTYLLDVGFNDKSRPATAAALKDLLIKHAAAGHTLRIEHGLSAHCRPDKVRYIIMGVPNPAFNPAVPETEIGGANARFTSEQTVLDPKGTKGCADDTKFRTDNPKRKKGRYYTDDFKDSERPGEYFDDVICECGAALRGFPSVERILPPLGVR